jgi:hypothetical protein
MGLAHSPRIATNGLVLALDAGNTKSYPGSGTTWSDLSGSGYHHTLSSTSLTTIDGVSCFNTSTTGQIRATSLSSTYTFGTTYTMIAWARVLADSQVTTWRTLWRTSPSDHPILLQDSTNLIGYYDNDTNTFNSYGLNAGTLGIENKWTMYTLVGSGGSTTCYINNNAASGTVAFSSNGLKHDYFGMQPSQPFGYVSIAQIYNRALTAEEIQQNFNALRGRFGV